MRMVRRAATWAVDGRRISHHRDFQHRSQHSRLRAVWLPGSDSPSPPLDPAPPASFSSSPAYSSGTANSSWLRSVRRQSTLMGGIVRVSNNRRSSRGRGWRSKEDWCRISDRHLRRLSNGDSSSSNGTHVDSMPFLLSFRHRLLGLRAG